MTRPVFLSFSTRDSIYAIYSTYIAIPFIRQSVCLSVTRVDPDPSREGGGGKVFPSQRLFGGPTIGQQY